MTASTDIGGSDLFSYSSINDVGVNIIRTNIVTVHAVEQESEKRRSKFKYLDQLFSETLVVDISLIDPGTRSLIDDTCYGATGGSCAALDLYLRQLPVSQAYIQLSWATTLWKKLFSDINLEFIVIFSNGSAETWEYNSPIIGGAFFTPEEGSSVSPSGSALGGGSLEEYDYVSNTGFNLGRSIDNSSTCEWWIFVTYLNGEIIGATFACY